MALDKRHRRVLQQNTVRLTEDLDPLHLLGYLYQEGAILEEDMDRVRSKSTRNLQAEELLRIIPRRGAKTFDRFCDVLYKVDGQRHLAKMLKDDIEKTKGNQPLISTDSPPGLQQKLTPDQITVLPTDARFLPQALVTDLDNIYKMQSRPRGLCLIINNTKFAESADLKPRDGSDADALNLQKLFLALHYTVTVLRNITAGLLMNKINEFAQNPEHSRLDSVVVCILSHGLPGKIYTVDGELIPITNLTAAFNGHNAKHLIGKPKLFFIQACRGGKIDHGASTDQVDSGEVTIKSTSDILHDLYEGEDETDSGATSAALVPAEADFLLAYSTVPGFVSWRNSEKGSWFVQALCEIFMTYAGQEDLVSMLIRVNGKVAREFQSYEQKKQVPSPVVRLTKKVYFFPGM